MAGSLINVDITRFVSGHRVKKPYGITPGNYGWSIKKPSIKEGILLNSIIFCFSNTFCYNSFTFKTVFE